MLKGAVIIKLLSFIILGNESISLSGYELVRYKDGDTSPSSNLNLDTQHISSNDFLVLLNKEFNADKKAEITAPTFESGSMQFEWW